MESSSRHQAPPVDALTIFEFTPNPYLILKPDFTIVAVNNAYLKATSTVREEIIGRGIFDVFPDNPKDPNATGVKNLTTSLKRVLQTRQPHEMPVQKYDIPIPGKPESEFEEHYWKPRNVPVLDEKGTLTYIIHHVEDVTETEKTKMYTAELEESEARFRQIANAMPQIVWTAKPDGYINWCNDWFYEYTGEPRRVMENDWLNVIHTDDRLRVVDAWAEAVGNKRSYSIEIRILDSKGTSRWHLVVAKPIKNNRGEVLQWAGVAIDIHELTLAREKIQENEARFRTITNAVPQIVWATLPNGYHDYFNDRWYEFTGVARGTTYGEAWIKLFHPDDRERLRKVWSHSLATGEPYEIEYRLLHRSGEYRWTLGRALPVRNADGKIIRWFGTCTDIHDKKKTEAVLKEAIQEREMYFSIASHELKTPLTTLGLQAQVQIHKLRNNDPGKISLEQFRSTMEMMNRQVKNLVKLVDEMLDLTRIRAGKLILERKSFNFCELLFDVLSRIANQFREAGTPDPILEECTEDAWGEWDPVRMEQVITNLLTNALRYGKGKPVKIRLSTDNSDIRLSVKDEGIGIASDALKTIFDPFERVTSAGKTKGLGLGLYITKQIVLQHGGKIWVESEPGKGSTFFVQIPRFTDQEGNQEWN